MARLGRSFGGLWFATGAANLGDGIILFALPLVAIASGATGGQVALITALATLAWPVVGLHAGWVVDHLGSRRILFVTNAVRAVVLGALAVAIALGMLTYPLLAAAAVIYGVAEVLVDTSLFAAIPATITREQSGRANARIEATINVSNDMLGAPLAGALILLGQSVVVGVSSGLYALALIGVGFVRRLTPMPVTAPGAVPSDRRVRAGLVFLWRNRTLRWLTAINATMNLSWAMWMAVMVLYVVAPGPLGASTVEYGLVFTVMAVGGVIASVVYRWLRGALGVRLLLAFDPIATVALVLAPALGANLVVCAAAAFLGGVGSSTWRILNATVRQHVTPVRMLGRAYSAFRAISWGALPAGASIAGIVIELAGLAAVFWVATAVALFALGLYTTMMLRHPIADMDGEPARR